MINFKHLRFHWLFCIIFLLTGCIDQRKEKIPLVQSNNVIDISFKRGEGKYYNIKLEDNSKLLVLNFFTSSCGVCKEEFKSLNELKNEFGQKIKVLGILGEKITPQKANEFIKKYKISYDVVSEINSVNLFSNAIGDVFGVPVTCIFNKKGVLKEKFIGYVPKNTLRKAILRNL